MDNDAATRLAPHVKAVADLAQAREHLNEEIRACVRDRLPISSIARAAGVSRQTIYDIAGDLVAARMTP